MHPAFLHVKGQAARGLSLFWSQPVIWFSPMLDTRLELLAARLRKARDDAQASHGYIAQNLDVDESTVSRWMNGSRTPTVKNLIELAELLGIEMTDLWDGPEVLPATAEQRMVVEAMKGLDAAQQQAILALISTMKSPK